MALQPYILETNQAKTTADLVHIWLQAMKAAGFDCVLFNLLTDHPMIDRRTGMVFVVNFPKDWLARYFVTGFEPMRQCMFSAHGAFGWGRLKEGERARMAQANIFEEGPKTGLYHGVGIPLRGPMGVCAGVTAAGLADKVALNDDVLDYVQAISDQFYKNFLKREMKPQSGNKISLTEREREVLTWYSQGKSSLEIGIIIGITQNTVKFYLKNIFLKLEVSNDRAAVLKAASMGLILPLSWDSRKDLDGK